MSTPPGNPPRTEDGGDRTLLDPSDHASGRPEAERSASLEQERPPDTAATLVPASTVEEIERRDRVLGSHSRLGKYEVVERFPGASGQGTAYKALDPDLSRHVVLKRYHAGPRGAPDEADEGRALAKVQSPYVARCHGLERIDGEAYLVVEFIPGRTLAQVQRDERLPVERTVRILALLAEGVSAVHAPA